MKENEYYMVGRYEAVSRAEALGHHRCTPD